MSAADAPLAGQVALVTGGGSGIGLASAQALARDGASVTICGRSRDRLDAALPSLAAAAAPGADVQAVVCDVADEESVAAAVSAAADLGDGALHLTVASAGTGTVGPIIAMPRAEWDRVLETNLTGTFHTFKHAGARIAASGGGAIVAISSIASPLVHAYMGPYCASKAGIDMLVRVLADELGRAGVRVNSVQPGVVGTELGDYLLNDPEVLDTYLTQMPISRPGTVEDIAAAVRFLCGPESSWITGQQLPIDGGHTLRRGPIVESWARAMYGDAAVDPSGQGAAAAGA